MRSWGLLHLDQFGQALLGLQLEAAARLHLIIAVADHDKIDDVIRLVDRRDLKQIGEGRLLPLANKARKLQLIDAARGDDRNAVADEFVDLGHQQATRLLDPLILRIGDDEHPGFSVQIGSDQCDYLLLDVIELLAVRDRQRLQVLVGARIQESRRQYRVIVVKDNQVLMLPLYVDEIINLLHLR